MTACMKTGCPAQATQMLKIVVPDQDDELTTAAEALFGLYLCPYHLDQAKAADFINCADGAMRFAIVNSALPGTDPDFALAYIEGVNIGSPEHSAYLNQTRGPN